jgi:hypothetical protein
VRRRQGRGGAAPPRVGEGAGPRRRRAGRAGAHACRGKREGARRGRRGGRGRERERRREERGAHLGIQLRQSPSPKPRAPQGDRGGRGRGRLLRGKSKWEREEKRGRMGGCGASRARRGPGRAGPGRAGLGWVGPSHFADRNPRHARPSNGLQSRIEI